MAGPVRVNDQHKRDTSVQRFNAWLGTKITNGVGTMWCAYVFAVIALIGFPTALMQTLHGQGPMPLVQWFAQTFIQLVLLSVIMVGQNIQGKASDARAESTFQDTVTILDRLDTSTEGGLREVLDAVKGKP